MSGALGSAALIAAGRVGITFCTCSGCGRKGCRGRRRKELACGAPAANLAVVVFSDGMWLAYTACGACARPVRRRLAGGTAVVNLRKLLSERRSAERARKRD